MSRPIELVDVIAQKPWVIDEHGLQLVLAVASRDEFFAEVRKEALAARDSDLLENSANAHVRDGVAILFVKGPLFRYASTFGKVSAATSYGELRKDLQRVLEDPLVNSIIFNVDSPGGEVNGCNELCEAIYAARGRKPMAVYVGGTCASAAYWIASAVGEIYCDETAELGSIGCKMCLVDDTDRQKDKGKRRIEIVSSQSPGKASDPHDDEYRQRLQVQCDDLAEIFINAVARNRGVSAAKVAASFGRGDVMIGQKAVDAGMANGISNFETVLADMSARGVAAVYASSSKSGYRVSSTSPSRGATTMPDLKVMARLLKLDENASEQAIEDRAQSLARFERDVLAQSDSKDSSEALGKIRAGTEALVERDFLKGELKAQQGAETKRAFRGAVKEALKEGRLTLGQASTVVPTFFKDEEQAKITAALATVKEQSRKEVLDALCAGDISPKRLSSVRAYLNAQSAQQVPEAHVEPEPPDQAARQQRIATVAGHQAALSELEAKAFGGQMQAPAKLGVSAEAVEKYHNVHSVEQIHATQKAKA